MGPAKPATPMPSAIGLVRSAVRQQGLARALGFRFPRFADLEAAAHHPSLDGAGASSSRRSAASSGAAARVGRMARHVAGRRLLQLLSPYSVGLLAFAIFSEDFR